MSDGGFGQVECECLQLNLIQRGSEIEIENGVGQDRIGQGQLALVYLIKSYLEGEGTEGGYVRLGQVRVGQVHVSVIPKNQGTTFTKLHLNE